jgi:hypothetical protein
MACFLQPYFRKSLKLDFCLTQHVAVFVDFFSLLCMESLNSILDCGFRQKKWMFENVQGLFSILLCFCCGYKLERLQYIYIHFQKTSLAAHEWFPLWISPYAAGMDDSNKLASRSNPHLSTEHIWATVGNKYTEFVHDIMQTISHANLLCFVSTTWNLHARTCAWVE